MSEPAAKQRQMINLDEFERRLGRPVATARSDEDPLAELARLVGGTEDRFKSIFQNHPAAPEQAPADRSRVQRNDADWFATQTGGAAHRVPPLGGDFAAIEAGLRGSIAPEYLADPTAYAEGESEDWLDAPYVPPTSAMAEPPRSRLPLYATAVIIIAGIAGIGVVYAQKHNASTPHEIAVIKAAVGPTKIQASASADSAAPTQDASILDKSPQPAPVAVVDRTEQPVDMTPKPQAPASPADVASLAPSGAAVVPVPPPPAIDAAQGQAFGIAGMIEPKKVKTITVRPDGTMVPNDASLQAALPTISPVTAPGPAPVAPATAPPDASPPKTTARAVATPSTPAEATDAPASTRQDTAVEDPSRGAGQPKTARAHSKPVKVAEADTDVTESIPPAASAGKGGNFAVQLAAPASQAEAWQTMAKLQHKFATELAGYHLKYRLASVASKSVYRVRVGGLSHEQATALCQKLQASGGNCFVARN